jgi:predicted alpha-1,2-mannosidase
MMRKISIAFSLIIISVLACSCDQKKVSYTQWVNPIVGTGFTGHTYPGAVLPFGMVAASPDTDNTDWDHCSGYKYEDSTIQGFSQTHLSGTGGEDMGDMMFQPVTGVPSFECGQKENPDGGYRSRFSHDTEIARPGYYAVTLDDYGIRVEATVTERCPIYRITFPKGKQAGVVFDLDHGIRDNTLEFSLEKAGDRSIKGLRRSSFFVRDHTFYFWADFSQTPLDWQFSENGKQLYVRFKEGSTLYIKMALSTVSCDGAHNNLKEEIKGWSFDKIAKAADRKWNEALSKIDVRSVVKEDDREILYTSLYHTMIVPNIITDVDGQYYGWDTKVHQSVDGTEYTNFSLWDTFRALHPLYNIICQDMNVQFINSWLEHWRQYGILPIHEFGIYEVYGMIGIHALSVIADAIMQDIPGFDYEEAYTAMAELAVDHSRDFTKGIEPLLKLGYIPSEFENNAVSKTLEYAYDEWCVAQVAKKLGKADDCEFFTNIALTYKNVFDTESGFVRGRHADGSWRSPFDPFRVSGLGHHDYTEGNAWQYTFYVPQDITTYIAMNGGDEEFDNKLDIMFNTELAAEDNNTIPDVTGLIGQYAHGNEPSHHVAYLYNYVGKPWKTQELVARIKREMYTTGFDGLCGNDDCGQMSAWYILSALGFYPVTPASNNFAIGTPSFPEVTVNLSNGKQLVVKAKNISLENVYIQSMTLNGRPYYKSFISVKDVMAGGEMEFVMGSTPNTAWGSSEEDRPKMFIE